MCEYVYGGTDEARGAGDPFFEIVGLSIIAC